MKGDLHCHSVLSDGSLEIDDILRAAKRQGIDTVAITDHDNIMSEKEAELYSQKSGVTVINGAEFSAIDKKRGRKVHILCFAPKNYDKLLEHCKTIWANRNEAGIKMAKKVCEIYPVSEEDVLRYAKKSKSIFKQHIMRTLIEYGYAKEFYGDVYQKLFNSKKGICYETVEYPDIDYMFSLLNECGATVVMAHPCVYNGMELAKELAYSGKIDGIEVFHHSNNDQAREELFEYCDKNNLIVTGGSDFHGMYSSDARTVGYNFTDEENLKRILK